ACHPPPDLAGPEGRLAGAVEQRVEQLEVHSGKCGIVEGLSQQSPHTRIRPGWRRGCVVLGRPNTCRVLGLPASSPRSPPGRPGCTRPAGTGPDRVRLARYLAHAGVASRRAAQRLVAEGRVTVGGAVVTDPAREVDESSAVSVDGEPVAREERIVYAVNKPAGVVSTARDTHGRPTVTELV